MIEGMRSALVDEHLDIDEALGKLAPSAQKEIRKYKRPLDQRVRLVSHHMKERLAGGRLITRTKYGKPVCDGVWFNVSHDGPCVVGIADERPVGIDIMDTSVPRNIPTFHDVFTRHERDFIGDDLERFYRIWTAKEAFLKMLGTGLHNPMESVHVEDDAIYFHGRLQKCSLRYRQVEPSFLVAICTATSDLR